jgi:hypothetical protein
MSLTRLRRADRCLLLALVCVACAAVFAPRAAAGVNKQVGVSLPVFGQVSTFPAEQPFNITHGWQTNPSFGGDQAIGLWQFQLTIDGVEVKPSFIETTVSHDAVLGTLLSRGFVFNFPDGMTGTHVFGTTYLGPCQGLVDNGFVTGPCAHPNDVVPTSRGTVYATITFGP